jgi:hypothetical protein
MPGSQYDGLSWTANRIVRIKHDKIKTFSFPHKPFKNNDVNTVTSNQVTDRDTQDKNQSTSTINYNQLSTIDYNQRKKYVD